MGKKRRDREEPFSLAPLVALLHEHLSEAICQEVFEGVRDKERQRDWTLHALARFWLAVVIEAPPALSHLLGRTRLEREGLLPHVMASDSAFYQRCQSLSSKFFAALYAHFIASIERDAPLLYAPQLVHLLGQFASVKIIDGSRLDAIAHGLPAALIAIAIMTAAAPAGRGTTGCVITGRLCVISSSMASLGGYVSRLLVRVPVLGVFPRKPRRQ